MTGHDGAAKVSRTALVTFGVGALGVLALQTNVHMKRAATGKWRSKTHKKVLSDSTSARLLAKLVAAYSDNR